MGEIETSGPGALELLQRLLSNDVSQIRRRAARSTRCSAAEDGGVLDDLFTYRLEDERFLTVTNASNHERDLAWFAEHAGEHPDARVRDAHERLGDARRPGPARARRSSQELADAPAAAADARRADRGSPARSALVCGTGYTGEAGVEVLCRPERRRRGCGTSSSRAAHVPRGWARATRCAWRPASTSTATT